MDAVLGRSDGAAKAGGGREEEARKGKGDGDGDGDGDGGSDDDGDREEGQTRAVRSVYTVTSATVIQRALPTCFSVT